MASRFDPSRFIAAEQAFSGAEDGVAGRVAPVRDSICDTDTTPICELPQALTCAEKAPVADVAGVAAPLDLQLPWRAGLGALLAMPVPAYRSPDWWQRLLDDAVAFSRQWGSPAVDLGWSEADLFGSHPNPYVTGVDRLGLVPLLAGRPVIAMTEESATIAGDRGRTSRFYRCPGRHPGVPIWVSYGCQEVPRR